MICNFRFIVERTVLLMACTALLLGLAFVITGIYAIFFSGA